MKGEIRLVIFILDFILNPKFFSSDWWIHLTPRVADGGGPKSQNWKRRTENARVGFGRKGFRSATWYSCLHLSSGQDPWAKVLRGFAKGWICFSFASCAKSQNRKVESGATERGNLGFADGVGHRPVGQRPSFDVISLRSKTRLCIFLDEPSR